MTDQIPKRNKTILKTVLVGAGLTILSLSVSGFNFELKDYYIGTPSVNTYFHTCDIKSLSSNAPKMKITERGFPFSFSIKYLTPICDDDGKTVTQIKDETYLKYPELMLNFVFWTACGYFLVKKYLTSSIGRIEKEYK